MSDTLGDRAVAIREEWWTRPPRASAQVTDPRRARPAR